MKLITKESDYAIRAVMKLAVQGNGYVSSRDLAGQEDIPLHFLRRILQALIKAGLVESKEGMAGGVRLKVRPQSIHLSDVIRLFQGDIQLAECMFRKKICTNRRTCVLRKRIKRIEDIVARELADVTIANLLQDQEVKK